MVALNKPSAGDTNWTTPINDNWTTIEGAIDQAICEGRLTLVSGTPVYNAVPKTPSATDTGNDTVDFPSPHGWATGTIATVFTTAGGLTSGNVYYLRAVDSDTVSFHTTLADAQSGSSKVNLTASITAEIIALGLLGTTVYFTPYLGDRIGVYDGSTWKIYTLTEKSLSLSGLIANVVYDVFIYDNSGTLTLEALAWKKVTASNSPTSGNDKAINVSDTSGVVVGSLVTIKDGSNSEYSRVKSISVNTSITVNKLANSYTTPDVYYPTRATALATQDGILVKSGSSTRRYLGMIRMTSAAGQCEDSQANRYVCNYYNRVKRSLFIYPKRTGSGQTNVTLGGNAKWQAINLGSGASDANVARFIANGEDAIDYHVEATILGAAGVASGYIGVGEDCAPIAAGTETFPGPVVAKGSIGTAIMAASCTRATVPLEGFHTLTILVADDGNGTVTYYTEYVQLSTSGLVAIATFLAGSIMG